MKLIMTQFRIIESSNITEILNSLDSELEAEIYLASESEIKFNLLRQLYCNSTESDECTLTVKM
jgi:hypothetical protein